MEALATRCGQLLAKELGLNDVFVERVAKLIVDMFHKKFKVQKEVVVIIEDMKRLSRCFDKFEM